MTSILIDPPLTRWYCDKCHQPIDDPQLATVCWEDPTSSDPVDGHLQHELPHRVFVLHKGDCDNMQKWPANWGLDLMLGKEGLQWWATTFLWRGPVAESMSFVPGVDTKPVMELFYRLHVPYYEQARRYFNSVEAFDAVRGLSVLTESSLKRIIESSEG